jgi:hypothetical protein
MKSFIDQVKLKVSILKIQIENRQIRVYRNNDQLLHDIIYELLNCCSKAVEE